MCRFAVPRASLPSESFNETLRACIDLRVRLRSGTSNQPYATSRLVSLRLERICRFGPFIPPNWRFRTCNSTERSSSDSRFVGADRIEPRCGGERLHFESPEAREADYRKARSMDSTPIAKCRIAFSPRTWPGRRVSLRSMCPLWGGPVGLMQAPFR